MEVSWDWQKKRPICWLQPTLIHCWNHQKVVEAQTLGDVMGCPHARYGFIFEIDS